MALANAEAGKLNHDYLGPAHLMLGLIAEGECVATEALRVLEVDLAQVRDQVRAQVGSGNGEASVSRRAHSKELKQVISLAIDEARKFQHRYVGTEHLILGLLAHQESIPSMVLQAQGVDLDRLREQTLGLLRSSVDVSHDLAHSRHGEFEWVHQQELAKAFRSPKFWHTMILACDSANRMGAGEIEPVHLLLALLRDPDSVAARLLGEKGVSADWVRDQLTHH
jgi:ATP-dependent Clp protease ATP-binding subunit ClpA